MTDLGKTIAPKSDQLNSDDLIGGPMTIKITGVNGNEGTKEQPINIFFEGDNNKPYRPCKSMRRVLVHVWGRDGSSYVGKSLTLYRDPEVKFGGVMVGGTRISHMSDISAPQTMALTATRANRKPFTVRPLEGAEMPDPTQSLRALDLARVAASEGIEAFTEWWNSDEGKAVRHHVKPHMSEIQEIAKAADITPEPDRDAESDPFNLTEDEKQGEDA